MRRLQRAAAVVLAMGIVLPAAADEFDDVLDSARSAYRDGDVEAARSDLEYALKILTDLKAESLSAFLPPAPEGWTRTDAEAGRGGFSMASMLGGGSSAAARYTRGAEEFTLSLVANSPVVGAISAVVSGMSSLGGSRRIQRTQFAVNDGDLQGVVNGKVMISASGDAPIDDMAAIIDLMDLRALGEF